MRELIDNADDSLFSQLTSNENHVLHQLLPARRNTGYDLRRRLHHDRVLTQKPISTVCYSQTRIKTHSILMTYNTTLFAHIDICIHRYAY